MSDAVFPILPGLAWSVIRTPQWSSNVSGSKSGRQYSVGDRIYPTYKWRLPYEFLRAYGSFAEWQTLFGFVNTQRGRVASFLYRDPNDFITGTQLLGFGDGSTKTWPLVRSLGGFVEPIVNADYVGQVLINGTPANYGSGAGQYRIDAAGPNCSTIITDTPVPAGQGIQWNGTWYWRCRFTMGGDAIPFEQFVSGHWKTDIEFESFRP